MRNVFSQQTRDALSNTTGGYLSRNVSELEIVRTILEEYNHKDVMRFDIGNNCYGYTPLIKQLFDMPEQREKLFMNLSDYPDLHYTTLRNQLSMRFKVPAEYVVVGAGVESFIDSIARVLFNRGDKYLLPVPNFYLFEEMSSRTGAIPQYLRLEGEDLRWSAATVDTVCNVIRETAPKVLWISNPVNPTGEHIPFGRLTKLVETATRAKTFIVVDEAYGEFSDHDEYPISAAELLESSPYLVVLRTFSKMFGLSGVRVGFLLSSSKEFRSAIGQYRQYFPCSWFSLYLAQVALLDDAFVRHVRNKVRRHRVDFFRSTKHIQDFKWIPSQTNTIMFKHKHLCAESVFNQMAASGILVANLNGVTGIAGEQFLRMTLQHKHENEAFIEAVSEISSMQS